MRFLANSTFNVSNNYCILVMFKGYDIKRIVKKEWQFFPPMTSLTSRKINIDMTDTICPVFSFCIERLLIIF